MPECFTPTEVNTSSAPLCHRGAGVKVSRNAPERHSRARIFKPVAIRLQNYWISQPEPTALKFCFKTCVVMKFVDDDDDDDDDDGSWAKQDSNLRHSNPIVNGSETATETGQLGQASILSVVSIQRRAAAAAASQ